MKTIILLYACLKMDSILIQYWLSTCILLGFYLLSALLILSSYSILDIVGKWWPHRHVLNGLKCLKWFKQWRPLFRNQIVALSSTSHSCCQFSIWMISLFLFLASLCMFKLFPQLSHLLLWCAFSLSPLV